MTQTRHEPDARTPTRASVTETARILGNVVLPILAQGVIARRPALTAAAERADLDGRGVRTLQRMRDRHGAGPLVLRIPGRTVVLPLHPDDVHRVLRDSPEPFAPATREKRGALNRFQPHGVLVSHGQVRAERRRFVEEVLDTGHPVHRLAEPFTAVAEDEAGLLREQVRRSGVLDWEQFGTAWRRTVRRIVLGDSARDDRRTTDLLTALREEGNWSVLHPGRPGRRRRLHARLAAAVDRAEPGSLAALVAATPAATGVDPVDQIPQWLFAFDPAGMATHRALGLLAAHPEQQERALAGDDTDGGLLRAAVLESVRLWPTTAVVLRETTAQTRWGPTVLPRGTSLGIISSFFHRDDGVVDRADRFDPDRWEDGRADGDRSLLPFSAGPVSCPGRELVLFTASRFLATLLDRTRVGPLGAFPLDPTRPLPRGLDPFRLRMAVTASG
jgi:cytochrome P450